MSVLPDSVREEVDTALNGLGFAPVRSVVPIGGGCVNNGARIETAEDRVFFLKWNPRAPRGLFDAEADGLLALRAAADATGGELRAPAPIAHRSDWLLMDWIEPGHSGSSADERLGRGLAFLHAADPSEVGLVPPATTFGWRRDNWIGSLPQSNGAASGWAEFWRERRIVPQLGLAREAGHCGQGVFDALVDVLPAALGDAAVGSLLHGDLWSGNAYTSSAGSPVLVDPAVYVGDGEVDLAMTELFGGFGPSFYAAYDEVRPISAQYRTFRRELYQLYYLLVHVNLFGGSYVGGAVRAAERVARALG